MEDKDKNVGLVSKPGKSIWRKSNFKKETGEKCKKNIRFNLKEDVHSDDGHYSSSKKDVILDSGEPSSKKRKKDIDMPNIPNEVEREIEMQIHSKAKESKLTTWNVKTILKSVITNKYVVDMVRAVEEGGPSHLPFEPKLTRAKTKELLQQHPDVPVPPVVGLLTPTKPSAAELSPEVKLLIDKELSEDSSDEEYNPENEPEPSEDEEKGDASLASDLDSLPPTPASCQAPATPVHDSPYDLSQDGLFKVPQENVGQRTLSKLDFHDLPLECLEQAYVPPDITPVQYCWQEKENVGQRTRSKLDFHDLPLECLEQAYVPPDITPDMYEAECDNPDWHDFLKEFTQPLAANETLDDDPENDPEYNILEDDEKDPVDYKEEMRKDKAVKVSKKELKALMKELFETESLSSEDEGRTSESIAELEASIMKETEDRQRREEEERKKKAIGFHPNQKLLLAQQLRQHVQLITQHFVQTYKHPLYHHHADTCRTMLVTLSGLKNDNVCCQETHNLSAAMDTVTKWETIHNHPQTGEKIRSFFGEQIKAQDTQKKNKKKMVQQFPTELMRLMMESEVVLYPMLLPPAPFLANQKAAGPNFFTSHEDMLLAICLEQVTQFMEDNKDVYKKRSLVDMCRVLSETCVPRSSPHNIAAHIRKLKGNNVMNPVKAFFEFGKAPIVCHYVIPVLPGKKLCKQPPQLLPEIWRSFLAVAYKEKEEIILKDDSGKVSDAHAKSNCSSEIKKKQHKMFREKAKELETSQRKDCVTTKEVKTTKNQPAKKTNKELGKTKEILNNKEITKPIKKVTINNIIKNSNCIDPATSTLCEKAKTTKKDLRSMLEKANSIQKAVRFNGQVTFDDERLKNVENKLGKVKLKIANPKKPKKPNPAKNKSKIENKEIIQLESQDKSMSTSSKFIVLEKIKAGKSPNSSKSKKKICKKKKKTKTADLESMEADFSNSVIPKMKFKVVSKTNTYYLKSENKKQELGLVQTKEVVDTNNQQENHGLKQLPMVLACQESDVQRTCSSEMLSTTAQCTDVTFLEKVVPRFCSSETLSTTAKPTVLTCQENVVPRICSSETLSTTANPTVVTCQENVVPRFCSSGTLSTTTQPITCSYLVSQIPSESDSHQSNSIESERTPLFVNVVKSFESSISHSPRPPSTVKLKDRLNCDSNFKLRSGKAKVPSLPIYSQLN